MSDKTPSPKRRKQDGPPPPPSTGDANNPPTSAPQPPSAASQPQLSATESSKDQFIPQFDAGSPSHLDADDDMMQHLFPETRGPAMPLPIQRDDAAAAAEGSDDAAAEASDAHFELLQQRGPVAEVVQANNGSHHLASVYFQEATWLLNESRNIFGEDSEDYRDSARFWDKASEVYQNVMSLPDDVNVKDITPGNTFRSELMRVLHGPSLQLGAAAGIAADNDDDNGLPAAAAADDRGALQAHVYSESRDIEVTNLNVPTPSAAYTPGNIRGRMIYSNAGGTSAFLVTLQEPTVLFRKSSPANKKPETKEFDTNVIWIVASPFTDEPNDVSNVLFVWASQTASAAAANDPPIKVKAAVLGTNKDSVHATTIHAFHRVVNNLNEIGTDTIGNVHTVFHTAKWDGKSKIENMPYLLQYQNSRIVLYRCTRDTRSKIKRNFRVVKDVPWSIHDGSIVPIHLPPEILGNYAAVFKVTVQRAVGTSSAYLFVMAKETVDTITVKYQNANGEYVDIPSI